MYFRPVLIAAAVCLISIGGLSAQTSPELADASAREDRLARQHWMLQCQGCHRPSGEGTPPGTPPLVGQVSSFLKVEGGREYLGRVPGVATAALNDEELARLLNWTLKTYDPDNMPPGFKPYTTEEIARLRRSPLRTDANLVRNSLIAAIDLKK